MPYFEELRKNWRSLTAACLGMSCGYPLTQYITSIFVPHLLAAFGWSKAQFSLIGTTLIFSIIVHPVAGRLTDVFGARVMVASGITGMPLIYLGYSAMSGNFGQYFWLTSALIIWVGSTTVSTIYSRLIAEHLQRARGLAIAISNSAAPVMGAIAVPPLSRFIDAHGWRAGYLAVATYTAIAGVATFLLIPGRRTDTGRPAKTTDRPARQDYSAIMQSPVFKIIIAGMFLCNLAFMVELSQLSVILLEEGMRSETASFMVSLFAISVVVGNLASGVAFDRLAPHIVTSLTFGIQGIGLALLAVGQTFPALLVVAVSSLGFCMGSEFSLILLLAMRFFRVEIYSSVATLIGTTVALSGALGSVLLSVTLKVSGSYRGFLLLSASAAIIGCIVFLLLGRPGIVSAQRHRVLR
jgi:MFS family permease